MLSKLVEDRRRTRGARTLRVLRVFVVDPRLRGLGPVEVKPVDADFLEGVAGFLQVIAVAHHPVEPFHLAQERFGGAVELDVDLRPADVQEWIGGDLTGEPDPFPAGKIGHDVRDDLSQAHFDLGAAP